MKIVQLYLVIMATLILLGCKQHSSTFNCDNVMQYYLNNNLSYPTSGEEYCLNIYRVDSLNGFPLLNMQKEISGVVDSPEKSYDYDGYNYIMDSLLTIEKNRIYSDPNFFLIDNLIDWQYIYRNKDDIKFEHDNDKLFLINTNDKKMACTSNILTLEDQFINNVSDVKFDIKLFSSLNDFMSVKLYTKDTLRVNLTYEDEFSESNIRNKISSLINHHRLEIGSKMKHSYLLHYNRDGEIFDFNKRDSIPNYIKQNKELLQYLNTILDNYSQAYFIHFKTTI